MTAVDGFEPDVQAKIGEIAAQLVPLLSPADTWYPDNTFVDRAVPGSAILDAPEMVESNWGDGHRSLWAKGEPFMICGPDGVGKTSLVQQLTLRLAGIKSGLLLGLPVTKRSKVLYLACDRPPQAFRSFKRMVNENDRKQLHNGLTIWPGPLPFDIAKEPKKLVQMAKYYNADTIVIDSLKDVAADLSKEESGSGANAAWQLAIAEGVEVAVLHHQRKAQNGAGKPNKISDVYGSRLLTGGCGSVVMLWGEAGDPIVEFSHLKPPDEPVGPWTLCHDHSAGVTTVVDSVDAWSIIQGAKKGLSANSTAILLDRTDKPNRNQVERARRQLDRLVGENKIHREGGGRGPGNEAMYYPLDIKRDKQS